jgi:hydrogenase maturation protease
MRAPNPNSKTPWLVIGYGNSLRRDDGLGPRLADAIEQLKLPGVQAISPALLTPELAEPIARARRVVFVDASIERQATVRLRRLSPAACSQIMAHTADAPTLLALARDVFGHAPQAWCLTIPAHDLTIGENLSPKAQKALAHAVKKLTRLIKSDLKPLIRS